MSIERYLCIQTPKRADRPDIKQAAVALIVTGLTKKQPRIFFIQRATNEKDPWSGQIAFPGGSQQGREALLQTAIRETEEEVGLILDENKLIGQLDDQRGRNTFRKKTLRIRCFIFHVENPGTTNHNREVAESYWIRLGHLQQKENAIDYQPKDNGKSCSAILLPNTKILWGLTYRFTQQFLQTTGRSIVVPDNLNIKL